MEPMQQPPVQPNPYGFITNPAPAPKKPLLGGSAKSRALLVGGIITILIIVAIIVSGILSSMSNTGTAQLKTVYAEQQELIRIAEIGLKDAVGADTRGFAATTLLSTRTSQQKLQALLSGRGAKLSPEEIAAKKNSKVEEVLTGASANNRYDETMRELLEERITSYNKSLQAAYDTNEGPQTREMLSSAFNSAEALVLHNE